MLTLFRSQSKVLMAILLALISLSFIVYFNLPTIQSLSHGDLGRIAGHGVTQDEFRLSQQGAEISLILSGESLPAGRESSERLNGLAWQRLVLLNAAREMKLAVSDQEVGDSIQQVFHDKDGKYNAVAYVGFLKNLAAARGISEARWEEIIRESLLISKAQQAVIAPASVDTTTVDRAVALGLGEVKASVIRFAPAPAASVAATPADVEKEYNDNLKAPAYRSPERRVVAYAPFLLTAAQEKLPAKEKEEAKHHLGAQAQEFAVAALDQAKDEQAFAALAAKSGQAAGTTAAFAATEAPAGVPASLSFNRAAFALSPDVPVSDAVETDHGYYVLKLVTVQPSAPLPFEQVRPLAEQKVRARLALRQARERGEAAAKAIHDALASGKTFAQAAADAHATVESVPAFAPATATASFPDAKTLVEHSVELQAGQASDFVPTEGGGLILFVEKRAPAAEALASAQRPFIAMQLLRQRQQAVFYDWLSAQQRRKDSTRPAFATSSRE